MHSKGIFSNILFSYYKENWTLLISINVLQSFNQVKFFFALKYSSTNEMESDSMKEQADVFFPFQGEVTNRTDKDGVIIEDIASTCDATIAAKHAQEGDTIRILYLSRVLNSNDLFECVDKKPRLVIKLGSEEVIKGLEIGLTGMRQGSKRRITCSPETAFGSDGHPPSIPPGATVEYEIYLDSVESTP